MQDRQQPTHAARGAGTAALLLVFCCAPAFAAGSDSLCALGTSVEITFDVPVDELTVTFVDLGAAKAVPEEEALPGTIDASVTQTPSVSTTPRVDRILREIFDEAVPDDYVIAEATPSSSPNAASLAELTAPVLREKSRDIDETRLDDAERDVTGVITRVPGLSEDEMARYRRQMLRTDI